VLPGTNFKTILKSMFSLNNKNNAPAGLGVVLAEMKAAGLSPQAIASNAARGIFYESPQGALPDKESGMTPLGHGAYEIPRDKSGTSTSTPFAHKTKTVRPKHLMTGLNDSTNRSQTGKGDIMKMLPGHPVKMLRLYDWDVSLSEYGRQLIYKSPKVHGRQHQLPTHRKCNLQANRWV
jgi:hypothetical protein